MGYCQDPSVVIETDLVKRFLSSYRGSRKVVEYLGIGILAAPFSRQSSDPEGSQTSRRGWVSRFGNLAVDSDDPYPRRSC